jgi:hypothetical protein
MPESDGRGRGPDRRYASLSSSDHTHRVAERTPAEKANDAVAERLHHQAVLPESATEHSELGITASDTSARFRRAFERELERTYCRVVRARAIVERFSEIADAMEAKLAGLQSADDSEPGPIDVLASKLDWSPAQRDLVWSIVACSIDPREAPVRVPSTGRQRGRVR